jgi:predicted metal-binding membrane protein
MKMVHAASIVGVVVILWTVSLVPWLVQAEERSPEKPFEQADATTEPKMDAEDSLQACMGRIPKDASIGQRMIAEQTCHRDESERVPFEAVPGARMIRHGHR